MERELKRIEVKYLNTLNELYKTLNKTSEISINEFFKSQRVGNNLSIVLQKMQILRSKKVGRKVNWYWIAGSPTSQMAIDFTLNAQIDREKTKGNTQPKVEVKRVERPILAPKPNPTPPPTPPKTVSNLRQLQFDYDVTSKVEKESVNVSILWGLFTYIKK